MPISGESVEALLVHIPSLRDAEWEPTSPSNPSYNCFAWAAREFNFWVEPPGTIPYRCWPDGLADWQTVQNYVRAYEKLGFVKCTADELEDGVEKIAIFGDTDDMATHAARQLPTGRWTSKWGRGIDFEHALETLDGDPHVGEVAQLMCRPCPGPPPDPPAGLVLAEEVGDEPKCVFDT
jgi:hypothetical protein